MPHEAGDTEGASRVSHRGESEGRKGRTLALAGRLGDLVNSEPGSGTLLGSWFRVWRRSVSSRRSGSTTCTLRACYPPHTHRVSVRLLGGKLRGVESDDEVDG